MLLESVMRLKRDLERSARVAARKILKAIDHGSLLLIIREVDAALEASKTDKRLQKFETMRALKRFRKEIKPYEKRAMLIKSPPCPTCGSPLLVAYDVLAFKVEQEGEVPMVECAYGHRFGLIPSWHIGDLEYMRNRLEEMLDPKGLREPIGDLDDLFSKD